MRCYFYLFILFVSFNCFAEKLEKPLVVITCSYNVEQWVKKRLGSILQQKYTNYRVVCVDDASSDNTTQNIAEYIEKNNLSKTWQLVVSKKRIRKLAHWHREVHRCKDDEIVVLLDGDDWLFGNDVFQKINKVYSTTDTWFTYGQYKNEPAHEAQRWGFAEHGYAKSIPEKVEQLQNYRNHMFIFMHLRTFYAGLFKKIKLKDLISQKVDGFVDDFFPASNDLAIVFPMVEMARGHITFVSDLLYVRNVYSDLVGFKIDNHLQVAGSREIRKKKRYKPLKKLFTKKKIVKNVDAVVILDDLATLFNSLHSIYTYAPDVKKIIVAYDKKVFGKQDQISLTKITRSCTNIIFVPFLQEIEIKNYAEKYLSDYVLYVKSSQQLTYNIDIKKCINWLNKTHATGWLLENNKDTSQTIKLDNNVYCCSLFGDYTCYPKMIQKKDVFSSCKKKMFLCG